MKGSNGTNNCDSGGPAAELATIDTGPFVNNTGLGQGTGTVMSGRREISL